MAKTIIRYHGQAPPDKIGANDSIKLIVCGNHIETMWCSQNLTGNPSPTPRKPREPTVDKETGEVLPAPQRYKSIQCAVRELRDAQRLIYTNVGTTGNSVVITLTYDGDMTDYGRIGTDLNNYHHCIRQIEPSYQFIDFVELGNRMTFHCHEIMVFDCPPTEEECSEFQKHWHKGQSQVDRITEQNLGRTTSYLTAYTTAPAPPYFLDEEPDIWNYHYDDFRQCTDAQKKEIKHYVKNKRLFYYNENAHIYRASKGLIKPQETMITFTELERMTQGKEPLYTETVKVDSPAGNSVFYYSQFDLTRT